MDFPFFGKIEFTQEHGAVTVGRDIKMIGCGDTAHGRYDNDVGDIGNDITKMANSLMHGIPTFLYSNEGGQTNK